MSEHIEQFCDDLRRKLNRIDDGLHELQSKISTESEEAAQDVRRHAEHVQQRIAQNESKVASARAERRSWIDSRRRAPRETIANWQARREIDKLEDHAAEAEGAAQAAVDLVAAALDDAEHAALEAWLARKDAEAAKAKQAR